MVEYKTRKDIEEFLNEKGKYNITNLDELKDWNVSQISNMSYIFKDCKNLVDISGICDWDVSNIISMNFMFFSCNSLDDVSDINSWNIGNVTDMSYMFFGCDIQKVPIWYEKMMASHFDY